MDARTRFLVSATHAYTSTAPATAAHLQSCGNELSTTDKARLHTHVFNGACVACGSILFPGLNSRSTVVVPQTRKSTHGRSSLASKASGKELTGSRPKAPSKRLRHECTKCGRYTDIILPKLEHVKSPVQQEKISAALQVPGSRVTSSVTAPAGDRRPRFRRKGGLRALLAEAQGTAKPSSSSLNLMDFMKSAWWTLAFCKRHK